MKHFKESIKTEDFVKSITLNTEKAIEAYKKHDRIWETYVAIAKYQVRALCIQGITGVTDFSDAWDELMEITGFSKLYFYADISEFITRL